MKTILRLAVLAFAGIATLAIAGNALATQKLSVKQSTTSLTIKVSQAQSDAQPAGISIYVPNGYSINTSAAPGTKIGSTSGTVISRDAANIPLPLSGDVIVKLQHRQDFAQSARCDSRSMKRAHVPRLEAM